MSSDKTQEEVEKWSEDRIKKFSEQTADTAMKLYDVLTSLKDNFCKRCRSIHPKDQDCLLER
jgi:hypothetical protein